MTDRDDATEDDSPAEGATEVTRREGQGSARPGATPGASKPEGYLARGTLVGRYVVLGVLGEGGMGVVYSAFDPELDRKIAIKLLQTKPGGSSGGDKAWLVREAQALAKLSHPNVVAVHDVGTLPGDRVFVAMELVDGQTLREWLIAEARTWRDIVPVMRAAGAGLAAAHAAGLVHRDFKPDNVIVGSDGRVRVMDFGLARFELGDDHPRVSDLAIETKSPLSERLTVAGTVVGTPAYMAPEIYEGHAADARTDQFAFGVALYEALFSARPYEKKDLMPPVSAAKPKAPPEVGVPAQIVRVVMRAISIAYADRYASMDDLLAELAIDPHAARRRRLIAVGAAIAVGALAGGSLWLARSRGAHLCKGAERNLAAVWDAPTRKTIEASFTATKRPYAAPAFAGVAKALDAYTGQWTEAVIGSCEATRIRGEQTEEVLSLRQECLDRRLEELRALVRLLVDADAGVVEKGDKVVFGLEPIASCANIAALKAPGEPPPAIRPKLVEVDKKLAEAKADLVAGKYLPAAVAASVAIDGATALHWEPIAAEALSVRGAAYVAAGSLDEAAKAYSEAVWAGLRAKRDDIVAGSALAASMMLASGLAKPGSAQIFVDLAKAVAGRHGVDRTLEIHLLHVAGVVAAERGDLGAGVALDEQSFAAAKLLYGADDPRLFPVESDLASVLSKAGAWGKAASHFEHALVLLEASVGPDHPDVALIQSNLGAAYHHTGEHAKAGAAFERALALREKFFGKKSPMLIATLDNYAEHLAAAGEHTKAIATVERARQLAQLVPGTTHPLYHQLLTDYGQILVLAGKLDEARALYDQAFELETQTQSAILPQTQASRAELALVERAWADAASFAERSIAGYEAAGGAQNPALWKPLTALARAKLGLGQPAAARPLLDRAIAIGTQAQVPADDLAPTRAALAGLPKP